MTICPYSIFHLQKSLLNCICPSLGSKMLDYYKIGVSISTGLLRVKAFNCKHFPSFSIFCELVNDYFLEFYMCLVGLTCGCYASANT